MVQIEIDIPYPRTTLAVLGLGVWWALGGFGGAQTPAVDADLIGGSGQTQSQAVVVQEAEEQIRDLRVEREVLSRRSDILRHQLAILIEQAKVTEDPTTLGELDNARRELVALLKDDKEAERQLLESLRSRWEAEGYAMRVSDGDRTGAGPSRLLWPVEPLLGISAYFHDEAYKARFGFDHGAIDIPTPQGTTVYAPADGFVAKVSDNGMGFSSLTISHGGGVATLYGHVSEFLVHEGDRVYAGDPIALSGGTPGTSGAGRITTGPHLHLEVYKDGKKVDPMLFMASYPGLAGEEE